MEEKKYAVKFFMTSENVFYYVHENGTFEQTVNYIKNELSFCTGFHKFQYEYDEYMGEEQIQEKTGLLRLDSVVYAELVEL